MEVKIELEDLSSVKKKLKVEIPEEETRRAYEEVSRKIASLARIPGFRPGKAPLGLIRSRFKNEIKDELIHDLVPKSYDEAVKSRDLKPLALPRIEKLDFQVGQPLQYEAVFEVAPEFELGEYKGLRLEKKVKPVTDEDIDQVIDSLREKLAKFIPVQGRGAQTGDQVVADIEGTGIDKESNEPTDEEPLKEEGGSLLLGDERTLPEFTDSLTGAVPGETREFTVDYVDDFARKEFAGKSIRYKVTLKNIKEKTLPRVDDDFAKEIGKDCESLEQLRREIGQDIEHRRQHELETAMQEQAIDQLLDRNRFEVPAVLVEDRVQQKIQNFALELASRGVDPARSGVNWQKIKDDLNEPSERDVRAALVLNRIAQAEALDPSEDELDDELERIAKIEKQAVEKIALHYEKENRMEELRDRLKSRKAMKLVLDSARVDEVSP
ncbi:MAG TPA: trigger factor [Acidobacteriota bacterium]|jgi:trigger factor